MTNVSFHSSPSRLWLLLLSWFLCCALCRAFLFPQTISPRPNVGLHMVPVDPWNEKQLFVPTIFEDNQPLRVNGANSTSQFGTSVSLKNKPDISQFRKRNLVVAVLAVLLAVGQYTWQFTHPVTPVSLLVQMTKESSAPQVIGTNQKPTLVDFWAPWCDNCQVMAPTLRALHDEYKDQVNFVTINADAADQWPLIQAFGVDAIPHLALVNECTR